jgi:hypothetical protein
MDIKQIRFIFEKLLEKVEIIKEENITKLENLSNKTFL